MVYTRVVGRHREAYTTVNTQGGIGWHIPLLTHTGRHRRLSGASFNCSERYRRLSGASLNGYSGLWEALGSPSLLLFPVMGGSREPLFPVIPGYGRLSGASVLPLFPVMGGSREPLYTRFTVG